MDFSLDGQTVLVTGATGFLGGHLVRALVQAEAQVRVLARASSNCDALPASVEVFRGAFDDPQSLDDAVKGADCVVHAAGGGKVQSLEDFYRDNRDSTQALIDAVRGAALKRFVLISSAAAHGPSPAERAAKESDSPHPQSHYGQSKLAAEAVALEARGDVGVSILRPPAIYGPGDTRMLGLFRAVARRILPVLGTAETSLLHVQDAVQAILRCLSADHESGRIYNVCDGQTYSHARIGLALEEALGTRAFRLPIHPSVLKAVGWGSEHVAKLSGTATFMTQDKVKDLLAPSWVLDSSLIQTELGFEPSVSFEEGAHQTAAWYQAEGWL